MRPFNYTRASHIKEAVSSGRDSDGSAYLAGGTTLIDLIKLDVMRPRLVVDVSRLPMNEIKGTPDGGLRIGANVKNSHLAWHRRVQLEYRALSEALLSGASPQLRNMATVAGNVMQRTRCNYYRDNISPCNKRKPNSGCAAIDGYNRMHAVLGGSASCIATHPSDMCVALALFDAVLEVQGAEGERRIPFGSFHLLPGDSPHREFDLRDDELITAVLLPPPEMGAETLYLKARDRAAYEFALASVAVSLSLEGGVARSARIALGGVATKPWRCPSAEALLIGQPVTAQIARLAAETALAEAQPLACNAFKISLAKNLIQRALGNAADACANPK